MNYNKQYYNNNVSYYRNYYMNNRLKLLNYQKTYNNRVGNLCPVPLQPLQADNQTTKQINILKSGEGSQGNPKRVSCNYDVIIREQNPKKKRDTSIKLKFGDFSVNWN